MRSRAARLAVTALLVGWSIGLLGAVPGTVDAATEHGVILEVNIQENGNARWTVTARYILETTNETAAFDRLIQDYVDGAAVGPSVSVFAELARRGENRTGRTMSIQAVNRSGEIINRSQAGSDTPGDAVGVLVLEFRWTSFADTSGEGIRLGDVFGGNWDLAADQTLVIRPPAGYSVDTVRPSTAVDGGVLRWTGPQAFGENEPAVVYLPSNSTPPPDGLDPVIVLGYVVGITVALLGGGLAVYAWVNRDHLFDPEGPLPIGERDPSSSSVSPNTTTDESTVEQAPTGESPDTGRPEEPVDPSLLSDEERVEVLLERNGGRMKQADIVSETDWSNAKVSQLLTSMADEDRVEKLRIGRENLITLAGETPEDDEG